MNKIRYFISFYAAKATILLLKLLRKNATVYPGKLAIKICPDFLGHIQKPKKLICITGTNGKTTVSNLVTDILRKNGYKVLNNGFGSNVARGIVTTLVTGVNFFGKSKYDIGILEIDERSSKLIYPYINPDYILCTNIFRDSMKRNANTEFILSILNDSIPKKTKLILNADDLLCSSISPENSRVYFGIDKLDTDIKECINIIQDIKTCPKCDTKLEYDYLRYHHIGHAHCPNCGFESPHADYLVTEVDFENKKIEVNNKDKTTKFQLIQTSIFNIYNMIAAISLLSEIGLEEDVIQRSFTELEIVKTRFDEEFINGKRIIMHLAKGQNPVACSRVFDYVQHETGNKMIILLIDDFFDAKESSENVAWLYDADFQLLNHDSIKQILVAGDRYLDTKLRLLLAGIDEDRIAADKEYDKILNYVNLKNIDTIYVLYDMYQSENTNSIKNRLIQKMNADNTLDEKEKE